MRLKWMAAVAVGLLAAQASVQAAPPAGGPESAPASAQTGAEKGAPAPASLAGRQQKISYGIGVELARNLQRQGIEVDVDAFMKGLRDALTGAKLAMTDEEIQTTLTSFQDELKQRQAKANQAVAEANKKQGEAFLAANKTKPGVVTLPTGLQYKVLKAGTGKKPTATDTVECQYRGTFIDGTEFDSSYKRGTPATFPVSGVIRGWTEALLLMPVGSKWQLFVPADLAYGPQGRPGIPPNSTLIFEVELLAIK